MVKEGMTQGVLCCIFNHNSNEKAIEWYDRLHNDFETVILDSGSSPSCSHEAAVVFGNIYYSGLMNEAYSRALEKGCRWLMIVTSDIEIDDANTVRLIRGMKDIMGTQNVALYQPSCKWSLKGRAHLQSMCHFSRGLRCVNFQEGWFHMVRLDIMGEFMPIDTEINRMGWGIDLALAHFARLRGRLVIVDDRVRVVHPRGTGYNRDVAKSQMREWLSSIPGYISPRHFRPRPTKIIEF